MNNYSLPLQYVQANYNQMQYNTHSTFNGGGVASGVLINEKLVMNASQTEQFKNRMPVSIQYKKNMGTGTGRSKNQLSLGTHKKNSSLLV